MAVDGSQQNHATRNAHESSRGEDEPYSALRKRAQEVAEAARETVAHSQELQWLRDPNGRGFASRCVWCRRFRVGERWLDAGARLPLEVGRTALTICDACTEALREAGLPA